MHSVALEISQNSTEAIYTSPSLGKSVWRWTASTNALAPTINTMDAMPTPATSAG